VTTIDLLDKTELWVMGLTLDQVDLRVLAGAAANALGLDPGRVFVTDVRDGHVVFDVIQPHVELEAVLGQQQILLSAFADVPGVTVDPGATTHSDGVLGVIGVPAPQAPAVLELLGRVHDGVQSWTARRVAVVATGAEVASREVLDTNTAAVAGLFRAAGFEVSSGGTVLDDENAILGRVLRLIEQGFGVVVTTGGVGAEDKDRTVEALQRGIPDLATSILTTYRVGHGRHVKPHVRVAVGTVSGARVIALPGPTHEVRAALPVVLTGLVERWADGDLTEAIAAVLRDLVRPPHRAAPVRAAGPGPPPESGSGG